MLELVSVEVENFRSFSKATFTPLGMGQGMTAVNGPNGSGKSSLATHALLWALYGVTPDGVPVRAMRKQGTSEEVSATVRFRHDGQDIVVTRALKGRNDTTVARILVDDVEQTNVSSRTASAWVTRRLGVDAEGFATAFVVKQKELDALVRARPAERRALIERLAGIEHMSTALAKSREIARATQSRKDALGQEPDMDEIEGRLRTIEAAHAQAMSDLTSAEAALNKVVSEREVAEKEFSRLSDLETQLATAESELNLLREKHTRLTEQALRLQDARKEAEGLEEARTTLSSWETTLAALEAKIRKADPLLTEVAREQAEVERLESEIQRLHRERGEASERIEEFEREIAAGGEAEEELLAVEAALHECMALLGAARADVERVQRTLDFLQGAHESEKDANCPMCREPLKSPESLKVSLRRELEAAREEQERLSNRQVALSHSADSLRQTIAEQQRTRARIETSRMRLSEIADSLHGLQASLLAAEENAESLAELAHAALVDQQDAESRIDDVRTRRAAAARAVLVAEEAAQVEGDLRTAQNKLDSNSLRLSECQNLVESLKRQRGAEPLDELRETVARLRTSERELIDRQNSVRMVASHAGRDVEEVTRELSQAGQLKEVLAAAAKECEEAGLLAAALEEFRRDRVARLAPELAEIASDLLNQMTDGRYSSIDLDEDFTPLVTEAATGMERPSAWLSGGEESAVALALRIAVGEVVAGQRGGLLVLDEVLTAQDQLRRNATMAALRGLPRQIVTINHVSEATDMVDLVVTVIPDEELGSRVEQAAPEPSGMDLSELQDSLS